jgi:putative ABC transport system permease protein
MMFRRRFVPSLRGLLAHKFRAVLALLSIAVGVAAVVLAGAIGAGARVEMVSRMENMGTNLLVVRPAQIRKLVARKTITGYTTSLKIEDYQAIRELAVVARAAPGSESMLRVKAGNTTIMSKVLGTSSDFPDVRRFEVRRGRFFDVEEDHQARRVAVLGARVEEELFNGADPVGEEIRIRGVPFEVIAVLEAKGVMADGSNEDNQVLIPIRTALRRLFNSTWLNEVFVSVQDPRQMEHAQTEIGSLLRARHGLEQNGRPDDFAIQNTSKFLAAQKEAADTLALFSTGLAGLALVVGGIGILALMVLSVRERTGEIGLRMAVGARPRDIFLQFLTEALFLALGGWMVGIALGAIGATAIALGTSWKIAVPLEALVASLGMAATTGLGFGAFPARKASLLPPIQALLAE